MGTIIIVGLGPGPIGQLTKEAEAELLAADRVFFRTGAHPVYQWLEQQGKHVLCFDRLYDLPWKESGEVYEFMVSALCKEAELHGNATFALPGSPVFLEHTTRLQRERASATGVQVRLIHGLSFVEEAIAQLNFDFDAGLQVVLPRTHVETGRFTTKLGLLVCQIDLRGASTNTPHVNLTVEWLLRVYPGGYRVTLIWTDGLPEYKTQTREIALKDLVKEYGEAKYLSSLYVPPLA